MTSQNKSDLVAMTVYKNGKIEARALSVGFLLGLIAKLEDIVDGQIIEPQTYGKING